ncbi:MAG: endonuclease/exonuclease/phosphatase family protein, partial [Prevotella sp.]|nr:endonuclease/exonuclease/phosphatase family protein [Prevotella sp.]
MKRILLVAILMVCAVVVSAQDLYVGTYNIRYKNKDDSIKGNVWTKRCQVMCDQINFESPDVLGMQEVLVGQLHDFQRLLDNYSSIGVGRDDGKEAGEYAAIFYKNDRVKLLDSGNFWLNETPDVPKLGWDAACIRICTWGKFKDLRTKKKFYFFNLHMDHVGVVARREAAKLVVSRIKEMAQDAPVVLTGDFNVDQTDEIYGIFTHSGILKDSYENAR